jgi:hypothetical protein
MYSCSLQSCLELIYGTFCDGRPLNVCVFDKGFCCVDRLMCYTCMKFTVSCRARRCHVSPNAETADIAARQANRLLFGTDFPGRFALLLNGSRMFILLTLLRRDSHYFGYGQVVHEQFRTILPKGLSSSPTSPEQQRFGTMSWTRPKASAADDEGSVVRLQDIDAVRNSQSRRQTSDRPRRTCPVLHLCGSHCKC